MSKYEAGIMRLTGHLISKKVSSLFSALLLYFRALCLCMVFGGKGKKHLCKKNDAT
jgi:hypothetical protein